MMLGSKYLLTQTSFYSAFMNTEMNKSLETIKQQRNCKVMDIYLDIIKELY